MTGGGKFGFAGYASSAAAPPPPVTPPGPLIIYGAIASPGVGDPATISGCALDSSQFPSFGISIGVTDVLTGTGQFGIAFNKFFDNTWAVPGGPNPTFVVSGSNAPGAQRTTIIVDSIDYSSNWASYGGAGSYEDVFNFGGFCENQGGTAAFSWVTAITLQSLSNGCVGTLSGASSTAQDSTFATIGGFGIGQYIILQAGRGGYPAPGDSMVVDITVTATNSGGSAQQTFRWNLDWF